MWVPFQMPAHHCLEEAERLQGHLGSEPQGVLMADEEELQEWGQSRLVPPTSDGGRKEQLIPPDLGWGQAGLANWSPLTSDGDGRPDQLVPSDLRWGTGRTGWLVPLTLVSHPLPPMLCSPAAVGG